MVLYFLEVNPNNQTRFEELSVDQVIMPFVIANRFMSRQRFHRHIESLVQI